MNHAREVITQTLAEADIQINGSRPFDIKVINNAAFGRVITAGEVGIGESYVDGWWDCEKLDEMVFRSEKADLVNRLQQRLGGSITVVLSLTLQRLWGMLGRKDPYEVGRRHYDLGNDLFEEMLGPTMVYTCAYWKGADNLDDAQRQKMELTCQKLQLRSGMRVLDIGGGWGSFAKYAAQNYGVNVVNITVSGEQAEFADQRTKGLPVENRVQDYNELNDSPYDRVVSLGMFEHVRAPNYKTFMETVQRQLKDDGIFLLHTIGANSSDARQSDWVKKYIFPNSEIPTLPDLISATDGLFVVEDLHNFGADYDKTLMAWFENFDKAWPKLKEDYDERFYRVWKYYLLGCAGIFRARSLQLWQIVLAKNGLQGGYNSVR